MADITRREAVRAAALGAAALPIAAVAADSDVSSTGPGSAGSTGSGGGGSASPMPGYVASSGTVPYQRINRDDAAVLFVDHQTGLTTLVDDYTPSEFGNAIEALVELTKFFELPAVLTTSFEDSPNGPMMPVVKDAFPDAPYIARPGQINAWDNEDFVNAVKATGKRQLIIAGIVTEVCVAFPALSARAEGYEVFVVTDASGTFDESVRHSAWLRMSQAGVQLLNWFAVASELHRDWRNDVEGFGKLLSKYTPTYGAIMKSYQALSAKQ